MSVSIFIFLSGPYPGSWSMILASFKYQHAPWKHSTELFTKWLGHCKSHPSHTSSQMSSESGGRDKCAARKEHVTMLLGAWAWACDHPPGSRALWVMECAGDVPCHPDVYNACHLHCRQVSYHTPLPLLYFTPNAGTTLLWVMWQPYHISSLTNHFFPLVQVKKAAKRDKRGRSKKPCG